MYGRVIVDSCGIADAVPGIQRHIDPGRPNERGRVNGQASLLTITINNTKMHHVNLSLEPYLEVTRWERMPGYFP